MPRYVGHAVRAVAVLDQDVAAPLGARVGQQLEQRAPVLHAAGRHVGGVQDRGRHVEVATSRWSTRPRGTPGPRITSGIRIDAS